MVKTFCAFLVLFSLTFGVVVAQQAPKPQKRKVLTTKQTLGGKRKKAARLQKAKPKVASSTQLPAAPSAEYVSSGLTKSLVPASVSATSAENPPPAPATTLGESSRLDKTPETVNQN